MLVIDAGCYGNDTKAVFTNFINNTCKTEYPAVWHQEGGKSPAGNNFNEALSNGGAGNPQYLIKPDKTFKKSPTAAEINAAGGNVQHVCGTHIHDVTKTTVNQNVVLYHVNGYGFTVNLKKECALSLFLYALNGQLVNFFSKEQVAAGIHTYNWGKVIPIGVYIADVFSGNTRTNHKVVIE